MSGGSEPDNQGPDNQSPSPPWANLPPWERGEQAQPPPEPTFDATQPPPEAPWGFDQAEYPAEPPPVQETGYGGYAQGGFGQQAFPGGQPPYGEQPPPPGAVPGPYGQGYPPGGGGPQGPPPGYGGPPPPLPQPPRGGGSKVPLVVALAVVGTLVLGGLTAGGVALVRASSDPTPSPTPSATSSSPTPTLDTPSPTVTSSTPSVPLPQRLNKRSADPSPLTVKELFPSSYKARNGKKYTRYATELFKDCGTAVTGKKLTRALRKGKCTQVAAATYVDKKANTVITVGLANLVALGGSKRVVSAVRPPANIVFKPISGRSPANFSGKSYVEWSEPIGHFTQWGAATYTNESPTRNGSNQKLFTTWADMREMLNKPLSLRMIKATP